MQTLKEIVKIIANCKTENDLLNLCLIVRQFKRHFTPLDLNFINITVKQKMIILNA
jgi:3-dehydroquinate dehydratase